MRASVRDVRYSPARLLGVGNPKHLGPTAKPSASEALLVRQSLDLSPLPHSRGELETAAKHFSDATIILGLEATKAKFLSRRHASYDFLHFAVHGICLACYGSHA